MLFSKLAGPLVLAVTMMTLWGCSEREPIRRYTVEKPPALAPAAKADPHAGLAMNAPFAGGQAAAQSAPPTGDPTDRTLAAIVPITPQGWFFKLTGPIEAVAQQEAAFTDFLKSVKFDAEGKPAWTLPEGWKQQPGNQFRYATLVLPGEGKPLEVTVSALPNAGDDNPGYVLVNVNRWRGQLQTPPIAAAELSSQSTEIKLDGATATLVNLTGHASAAGMGRPPFASGAPNGN